ncbi:Aste57867_14008 [Aphanomyces stellatus]|uniref:Aste57867_14008 protein n=1 Tax=Aphanomyces stellatus TaxID=120398 RepID=A0A485KZX2_9STRA|nr:hypothetical protein As57867_013957 [Aphanomyces stellatus]VFT90838.1 Aste57867_14008 [Aphanomyces stellatus]
MMAARKPPPNEAQWLQQVDAQIEKHLREKQQEEKALQVAESLSTIPETSRESFPSGASPATMFKRSPSAARSPTMSAADPRDNTSRRQVKEDIFDESFHSRASSRRTMAAARGSKYDSTPTKSGRPPRTLMDATSSLSRRRGTSASATHAPHRFAFVEKPSPFRPQHSAQRRLQSHLDEATAVLDAIQREKLHQSHLDLFAKTLESELLGAVRKQKLQIEHKATCAAAADQAARVTIEEMEQEFQEHYEHLENEHGEEMARLEADLAATSERLARLEGSEDGWIVIPAKWTDAASWVLLALSLMFALVHGWQCVSLSVAAHDDATVQELVLAQMRIQK